MWEFWCRAQRCCPVIPVASAVFLAHITQSANSGRRQNLRCVETSARTPVSFRPVTRIEGLSSSWSEAVKLYGAVSQKAPPPRENKRCPRARCESVTKQAAILVTNTSKRIFIPPGVTACCLLCSQDAGRKEEKKNTCSQVGCFSPAAQSIKLFRHSSSVIPFCNSTDLSYGRAIVPGR